MKTKLQLYAKQLRVNATDAERKLWRHLRSKQLNGLKFRRQEPIGRYIVDFVCYKKKVIIEVDGSQHMDHKLKDNIRDEWFSNQEYKILRFWDNEVLKNINEVLEVIRRACL